MSSWFSRVAPGGKHWIGGNGTLTQGGQDAGPGQDIGPGYGPKWVAASSFLATIGADLVRITLSGARTVLNSLGCVYFDVAPDGRWVLENNEPQRLVWHDGGVWPGYSTPAISNTRWAMLVHDGGALIAGTGQGQNGVTVDAGPCLEPRLNGDTLVWRRGNRIFGQVGHQGEIVELTIKGEVHFWPVPLVINGESWVLTNTNSGRLLLYPFGSHVGYEVVRGITDFPDAQPIDSWHVRVVWSENGEHRERTIDLSVDMVPLAAPQPLPDIPWTGTQPVDLTPFIVGDDAHWPRTGSHDMDRIFDGRNLWWLKFGDENGDGLNDNYERWVLVGDSWYLREDHSQSGAGIYSFHPGRWFPRVWALGGVVECFDNILQRYEPGTGRVLTEKTGAFPYVLRFLQAWSRITLGGSIGTVTSPDEGPVAVLLEYDPGGDRDTRETGLYVRGWGSTRWNVIDQKTGQVGNQTEWSMLSPTARRLRPTPGCYRDLVLVGPKPAITIAPGYGPTGRPLEWHAVAQLSGGPTFGIVWRWRKQGTKPWSKKFDDNTTTVTVRDPGIYEVGVDAYGPGGTDGTATPRLIVVTA